MLPAFLIMIICVLALYFLHRWFFCDRDCDSSYVKAFIEVFGKKEKEK